MDKIIYGLIVRLDTDGDYHCKYKHKNMTYNDDSNTYDFAVVWDDKELAIKEAKNILLEMKRDTLSSKNYIQRDTDRLYDEAINKIADTEGWLSYLTGNQEGTAISFRSIKIKDDSDLSEDYLLNIFKYIL